MGSFQIQIATALDVQIAKTKATTAVPATPAARLATWQSRTSPLAALETKTTIPTQCLVSRKKIPIYPTNLLPYPSRIPLLQLPKSFKQHRIHHWANRENPDLISCWWLQGRPTGTVHLCCSASSRLNLLKWVSHPSGCQRFVVWKYVLINSI